MKLDRNLIGPFGIDLDNTIISYDRVFYRIAMERNLIRPGLEGGKKAIRDAIRMLPNGEIEWQIVQAEAYGPAMQYAELIEGVRDFLGQCASRSIPFYIISHKTEYANYDLTKTNLRESALTWLSNQGFFDRNRIGLPREYVFFESSRCDKIRRINDLGCTCFIDDLEETFLEESFPASVQKILFDPYREYYPRPGLILLHSWKEITTFLLSEEQ